MRPGPGPGRKLPRSNYVHIVRVVAVEQRQRGLVVGSAARIGQVVHADAEQPDRPVPRLGPVEQATARAAMSSASRVAGVFEWLRVMVVKSE